MVTNSIVGGQTRIKMKVYNILEITLLVTLRIILPNLSCMVCGWRRGGRGGGRAR